MLLKRNLLYKIFVALIAFMIVFSAVYWVFAEEINPEEMTANAVMLLDQDTGAVLYEKNPDMQVAPASTTKLLTAVVVLEHLQLTDCLLYTSGDGGNGAVSFRREKYIAAGGPDGGNGGKGGDILFQADKDMRTLIDFRYKRKFAAGNGSNGGKRNMAGKDGEDLIIKVPEGTVILDEKTGRVVADLHSGIPRVILKGGRGGKGNANFATPTRHCLLYTSRCV